MHTIEDLRQALAEETADLTTRLTVADVRAAANRRRMRTVAVACAAALVPLVSAGTVVALGPGTPSPAPTAAYRPSTVVPWYPDPSLPPGAGRNLSLGQISPQENLEVWYQDAMNGVMAGLHNQQTRQMRLLEFDGRVPKDGEFGVVTELELPGGKALDFGLYGGNGRHFRLTVDGDDTQVDSLDLPDVPGVSVFFIRRDRPLVGSTDAIFTAFDADGRGAGGTRQIERSRGVTLGATLLGDWIRTGLTLADGGELVFWFDGDQRSATLHAGSDDRKGTVTELRTLLDLRQPPDLDGFFQGYNRFELAGGDRVVVGVYAGDAARVEMRANGDRPAPSHGSAEWTAYPRVRVLWATGIDRPFAVARDRDGRTLATADFPPATSIVVSPAPSR
ncbi:hypothetical protein [Dactylosporangium sp. NPDC048998]|uniref:hypothetical protein n=1 Tax=Dactylosporangium sp. NPDC048998 TaxID=3363976 RepID=UPI003712DC46